MRQEYHEGQRELQDRFDTRRLADGVPQCSYKGGEPGFVRVLDLHTIAFPVYDGNGMFLSMGNVDVNPNVAILFIDFDRGTRLRFNGIASIEDGDPLIDSYPGAQFVVRVRGEAVFANCRRYVHRYELVERSQFVPSASADPPVPDWKLDPWFEGTLPKHDPARDPDHPTAPAIPQF